MEKCFVLSFYCSTMLNFSSQSEAVTVSHFSLWPSLLKKVSLVAMQTVESMFHHFAFKSKARTMSYCIYNVMNTILSFPQKDILCGI